MSAILHEPKCLTRPNGTGYAVGDVSRVCLQQLIDAPDSPFEDRCGETVKEGRTAQIVRTKLPLNDQSVPVAYKRIRRKNWWKVLTALVRTNRTFNTWRLGHTFLKQGITTARPLAVIVPRAYRIQGDSFLVTEWIEGSLNLHHYLKRVEELESAERHTKLKTVAESLGDLLGRMHGRGIGHRDLKPGNLLVVDEDDTLRTLIIDLDGAQVKRRISRRRRYRDLARLAVGVQSFGFLSRSLRLRFLLAYLYGAGTPFANWKNEWHRLSEASERLRHKKQNR